MRKEWLDTDFYALLGVDKKATHKEIKKAYRKLAQEFHPDANQGDATAETRFKQISEAYAVVGDPEQRKEYDHAREMGQFVGSPSGGARYVRVEDLMGGAGGGGAGSTPFDLFGGLGDLFGQARTGPIAGADLSADMSLSFHEAVSGVTKEVNLGGKRVKVKIPRGVSDGARIRVKGRGNPGSNGGPNGDLFVTVHVGTHPLFRRSGANLEITAPVTFAEAALGADIDVPTLDGKVRLKVPPGTQPGQTLRASGRGVENSKGEKGDLLVKIDVVIPRDLSDEERTMLEKLRDMHPENPRAHFGV